MSSAGIFWKHSMELINPTPFCSTCLWAGNPVQWYSLEGSSELRIRSVTSRDHNQESHNVKGPHKNNTCDTQSTIDHGGISLKTPLASQAANKSDKLTWQTHPFAPRTRTKITQNIKRVAYLKLAQTCRPRVGVSVVVRLFTRATRHPNHNSGNPTWSRNVITTSAVVPTRTDREDSECQAPEELLWLAWGVVHMKNISYFLIFCIPSLFQCKQDYRRGELFNPCSCQDSKVCWNSSSWAPFTNKD